MPTPTQTPTEEKTIPGQENQGEQKAYSDPFARLYEKFGSSTEPAPKTDSKPAEESKAPVETPENAAPAENKNPEGTETQPAEPEYDEIVYNKEKVKIPVAERQTYLQKGYNYDKVKEQADKARIEAEQTKAVLLDAAKAEGFNTVEEYLAEIRTKKNAVLAAKIEEASGDPEALEKVIQEHPLVKQTQEERRKLEEEKSRLLYEGKKNELRKDPYFKDLETEFDGMMVANPTVDPDLAYSVLVGQYVRSGKLKNNVQEATAAKEKAVLADMHDKAKRGTPVVGNTGETKDSVMPSDFTKHLSGVFGVNPSKVAQRAREIEKRRTI